MHSLILCQRHHIMKCVYCLTDWIFESQTRFINDEGRRFQQTSEFKRGDLIGNAFGQP